MTNVEARAYMLSKRYTEESFPFSTPVPVMKVGSKMFATINIHESERVSINLKNTELENRILRESFEDIMPGYHMNKKYWNTIYLDGSLEDDMIKSLIDESYRIVYESLTNKERKVLENG